ncbi:hypothetical protein [Streptomyces eurythermus]
MHAGAAGRRHDAHPAGGVKQVVLPGDGRGRKTGGSWAAIGAADAASK